MSVQYSPEIAEGEEVELRKADGTLCVSDRACDELKWINVEAQFCGVDPDLLSLFTGYPVVLDHAGASVGSRITSEIRCEGGVALEVWSDITDVACGAEGGKPYGYFLLPCLVSSIISEFTVENDALTLTLTGRSRVPAGWGVGPYDVVAQDDVNTPGPLLTPIGPQDHMHLQLTTVEPPEAQCGCQPLEIES